MKIQILYESKYSLSTVINDENVLTGMGKLKEGVDNSVKNIFKKENNFIENIKELNKFYPNYQYADITKSTVLGILCRLVGEIRRLDMLDNNHPILSISNKITFENNKKSFQNEILLLHTPLKEVENNAGGIISKENHFLLSKNDLSETLLSVFNLKTQNEIVDFLISLSNNDKEIIYQKFNKDIKANTFMIEHLLAEPEQSMVIKSLNFNYGDKLLKEIEGRLFFGLQIDIENLENYIIENKNKVGFKPAKITEKRKDINKTKGKSKDSLDEIFNIWGFLFAKKINFLQSHNLFEEEFKVLNSVNSIKGLAPSSGSMTIKDFYSNFVDEKKVSWTMPYFVDIKKDLVAKGDESLFNTYTKLGVTKESGELNISLDLSMEEELKLYKMIENAGVNVFHMGKKGLAYINDIKLEKI